MIRRFLLAGAVGALFVSSSFAADIVVRVAPPRPVYERRVPPPGRGYVWTPGYHRWEGQRYVWVPGQYMQPPRPRARWVAGHWARRGGGWVFVEGHWR